MVPEKAKPVGLDGIELIMAIEEAFGVTIEDSEVETLVTPAAVIDLVFGKLRTSDERVCVTQRAFYLIRKGLIRTLGVSRRSVTIHSEIRLLAKGKSEPQVWEDLQTAVGARRWPALARPGWLVACLWLLSASIFGVLLVHYHWLFAAAGAGVAAMIGSRLTVRYRNRIPGPYSRVDKLVPMAATSEVIVWTRDQVAAVVKKRVIEQLGLREKHYREEADFVKELGMG